MVVANKTDFVSFHLCTTICLVSGCVCLYARSSYTTHKFLSIVEVLPWMAKREKWRLFGPCPKIHNNIMRLLIGANWKSETDIIPLDVYHLQNKLFYYPYHITILSQSHDTGGSLLIFSFSFTKLSRTTIYYSPNQMFKTLRTLFAVASDRCGLYGAFKYKTQYTIHKGFLYSNRFLYLFRPLFLSFSFVCTGTYARLSIVGDCYSIRSYVFSIKNASNRIPR